MSQRLAVNPPFVKSFLMSFLLLGLALVAPMSVVASVTIGVEPPLGTEWL